MIGYAYFHHKIKNGKCSSRESKTGNSNIDQMGTSRQAAAAKEDSAIGSSNDGWRLRMVKAVGMKKQEIWVNWEATRKRKVTLNDIWSMEPKRLQFLLRSVYDVLPRSLWQIVRREGRGHGVSQWWLACGALLENPCGDPWESLSLLGWKEDSS